LIQKVRFLKTFASDDAAGQQSAVAEAVEAARQGISIVFFFSLSLLLDCLLTTTHSNHIARRFRCATRASARRRTTAERRQKGMHLCVFIITNNSYARHLWQEHRATLFALLQTLVNGSMADFEALVKVPNERQFNRLLLI
jgi:hypothetical protein